MTTTLPADLSWVGEHLSEQEIAAYLDGTLASGPKAAAELHLANCAECRTELTSTGGLVASLPPPRKRVRSWWWIAGAAAAAALAIAVVPRERGVTEQQPIERRIAGDASVGVRAVWPSEGAVVAREQLQFVWRRDDDASYRVTLTDSVGGTLWSGTTGDTTLVLPPEVEVRAGASLHWYVDALRLDGTAGATGPVAFRIP